MPGPAQFTLHERPAQGHDWGVTVGDGMASGDRDKDHRLAGALRQQAINEVLLENDGQQDKALIISALTAALIKRGLSTPTAEWLEGVATDVALGHAYVVSADSLQAAAALEMPDDAHLPIPEPSPAELLPPDLTISAVPGDRRAGSLDEGTPASPQMIDQTRSQSTTRNRERVVATVLFVVVVAVWAWVLRSRPGDALADSTGQPRAGRSS